MYVNPSTVWSPVERPLAGFLRRWRPAHVIIARHCCGIGMVSSNTKCTFGMMLVGAFPKHAGETGWFSAAKKRLRHLGWRISRLPRPERVLWSPDTPGHLHALGAESHGHLGVRCGGPELEHEMRSAGSGLLGSCAGNRVWGKVV